MARTSSWPRMIEATGVTKAFRGKFAVQDVSIHAADGEITYLLGPNGAGKSTLMRMMAGLIRPDSGTITFGGRGLRELRRPITTVGFNLAPGAVNPGITARQHLKWQADLGGIGRERIDSTLELVGLQDVGNKRIGKFSLGMAQRLGIASALIGNPRTLILDEPSNGLDVDGTLWLRELFLRLARSGRSLLIASHDLTEVEVTGDRIVVMGRGRVLADLPKDEILRLGDGPRRLEDAYLSLTRESVEYVGGGAK